MAPPSAASKCGKVQPPSANPPTGSSSGPPGACMTPSRLMKVETTIRRILVPCLGYGFNTPRTCDFVASRQVSRQNVQRRDHYTHRGRCSRVFPLPRNKAERGREDISAGEGLVG